MRVNMENDDETMSQAFSAPGTKIAAQTQAARNRRRERI